MITKNINVKYEQLECRTLMNGSTSQIETAMSSSEIQRESKIGEIFFLAKFAYSIIIATVRFRYRRIHMTLELVH